MRRRHAWALVLLFICGSISAAWADEAKFSAPKDITLALGDSLAFGFQRAKFDLNPFDLAQFHTGFAFVFAARVAATPPGRGTTLLNLGCPGETTTSFLDGPCLYHFAGLPLHFNYTGAQMDVAEEILALHRGQVSPILISLGANDVLGIADVCGPVPGCIAALLPGAIASVLANYDEIVGRLRAAAPDAEIVLLQYYNPLVILSPALAVLGTQLNDAIATVAAAHRARLANAFPAFNLAPPQPATLCALTLMCVAGDIHASDAGYAVIADLMFQSAGFTRFEH